MSVDGVSWGPVGERQLPETYLGPVKHCATCGYAELLHYSGRSGRFINGLCDSFASETDPAPLAEGLAMGSIGSTDKHFGDQEPMYFEVPPDETVRVVERCVRVGNKWKVVSREVLPLAEALAADPLLVPKAFSLEMPSEPVDYSQPIILPLHDETAALTAWARAYPSTQAGEQALKFITRGELVQARAVLDEHEIRLAEAARKGSEGDSP